MPSIHAIEVGRLRAGEAVRRTLCRGCPETPEIDVRTQRPAPSAIEGLGINSSDPERSPGLTPANTIYDSSVTFR